jgi:hypothetical protein
MQLRRKQDHSDDQEDPFGKHSEPPPGVSSKFRPKNQTGARPRIAAYTVFRATARCQVKTPRAAPLHRKRGERFHNPIRNRLNLLNYLNGLNAIVSETLNV